MAEHDSPEFRQQSADLKTVLERSGARVALVDVQGGWSMLWRWADSTDVSRSRPFQCERAAERAWVCPHTGPGPRHHALSITSITSITICLMNTCSPLFASSAWDLKMQGYKTRDVSLVCF